MKGCNFGRLFILYILQSIYMLISMGKHKGNLNSWGVRDKCQHLWAAQQILVPSPLLVPFALAEPLMEFILSMGWVEQGCVQGGTAAKAPSTQIWAEKQHMEGKNPTWGMRRKCVRGFSEQHHQKAWKALFSESLFEEQGVNHDSTVIILILFCVAFH